jgi:hypothetical protein
MHLAFAMERPRGTYGSQRTVTFPWFDRDEVSQQECEPTDRASGRQLAGGPCSVRAEPILVALPVVPWMSWGVKSTIKGRPNLRHPCAYKKIV